LLKTETTLAMTELILLFADAATSETCAAARLVKDAIGAGEVRKASREEVFDPVRPPAQSWVRRTREPSAQRIEASSDAMLEIEGAFDEARLGILAVKLAIVAGVDDAGPKLLPADDILLCPFPAPALDNREATEGIGFSEPLPAGEVLCFPFPVPALDTREATEGLGFAPEFGIEPAPNMGQGLDTFDGWGVVVKAGQSSFRFASTPFAHATKDGSNGDVAF
jgi:hypothetical protein